MPALRRFDDGARIIVRRQNRRIFFGWNSDQRRLVNGGPHRRWRIVRRDWRLRSLQSHASGSGRIGMHSHRHLPLMCVSCSYAARAIFSCVTKDPHFRCEFASAPVGVEDDAAAQLPAARSAFWPVLIHRASLPGNVAPFLRPAPGIRADHARRNAGRGPFETPGARTHRRRRHRIGE